MLDILAMIVWGALALNCLYFIAICVKYFSETGEIRRRLAAMDLTDKVEADRLRDLESRGDVLLFLRRDGGLFAQPYVQGF